MARKLRIDYKGALYHVMCRGNNGEYILKKGEDKQIYLDLIKKYKERYGFKIYAYCIMDNHVHMLIEREEVPLSKIMQGIQQSYTQRYNRKNKRTGHVFQQRYKAELCNKEEYLLQLIKYIHMNPVKAGFKEGLDYRWSSHRDYVKGKQNDLIELKFVLGLFSNSVKKGIKGYLKFMGIKNDNLRDIKEYLLNEKDYINSKEEVIDKATLNIDELIARVCEVTDVKREDVVKRTKIQRFFLILCGFVIL